MQGPGFPTISPLTGVFEGGIRTNSRYDFPSNLSPVLVETIDSQHSSAHDKANGKRAISDYEESYYKPNPHRSNTSNMNILKSIHLRRSEALSDYPPSLRRLSSTTGCLVRRLLYFLRVRLKKPRGRVNRKHGVFFKGKEA